MSSTALFTAPEVAAAAEGVGAAAEGVGAAAEGVAASASVGGVGAAASSTSSAPAAAQRALAAGPPAATAAPRRAAAFGRFILQHAEVPSPGGAGKPLPLPLVALGSLLGVTVLALVPFLVPGVSKRFRVPYNPTEAAALKSMLRAIPPGARTLVDLGSGDGRICLAAARELPAISAVGWEFNPVLVAWSRARALLGGAKNARYRCGDFMSESCAKDLRRADVVVLYGVQEIMQAMGPHLAKHLPKGATVLTNTFMLPPPWVPHDKQSTVLMYRNR